MFRFGGAAAKVFVPGVYPPGADDEGAAVGVVVPSAVLVASERAETHAAGLYCTIADIGDLPAPSRRDINRRLCISAIVLKARAQCGERERTHSLPMYSALI
eukprot:Opistho-2@66760